MVGRTSLRAAGNMRFDVKTKRVLTERQQLSTTVVTSFSKFIYPKDPQVHRSLFRDESLKCEELRDFLGDLFS